VYINIENSTDLADLDKVNKQLKKKYNGLKGAINKVSKRIESVIAKYWAKSNKNV
jgi:autotransporter adhesin